MQQVPVQAVARQTLSAVLGGQQVNLSIYALPQVPQKDVNALNTYMAASTQFGTGDGRTKAFSLDTDTTTSLQSVLSASVYKTDWQGHQLQYSTPRTNSALYSQQFANPVWFEYHCSVVDTPGQMSLITATGSDNTFWGQNNSTEVVSGVTKTMAFSLKFGSYTGGIRLFLRTSAGVNVAYSDFFLDTATVTVHLGTASISPDPSYAGAYRCAVSGTFPVGAPNGWSIYCDPINVPVIGETYYCADGQIEFGAMPTSKIVTGATAVTVTDYSIDSTGNVTFSSAPAFNAALTWDGSYTYRYKQGDFLPAPLFMDVSLSNTAVCTCVPCFNLNKIVRGQGGFIGDLIFQDTQGSNDPTYDGLGSRYLLQYLEAADV